jgi:hypothetical protein
MNRLTLIFLLAIAPAAFAASDWISLFNGKDFTGWKVGGDQNAFQIKDGDREEPANATLWTTRTLARALGISEATVRRRWHAYGLKPHLVDTFQVSRAPSSWSNSKISSASI